MPLKMEPSEAAKVTKQFWNLTVWISNPAGALGGHAWPTGQPDPGNLPWRKTITDFNEPLAVSLQHLPCT